MNGDHPILIEIDQASWKTHLDKVEPWLATCLTNQAAFRQLLEKVAPTLKEPHFRQFVGELAETARRHESEAERFFKIIGRTVPMAGKRRAALLVPTMQSGAEMMASLGGAEGSWLGLQALLPAALNAQSGFAVTEQLALALGIRELAEAAYDIENEQAGGFLVLKELLLESAAISILYKLPV